MKISFVSPVLPKTGVLILLVAEGKGLEGLAAEADHRTGGQVTRAMAAAKFTGKRDTTLDLVAPGGGFTRIVLFGLGAPAALRPLDLEMLGGAAAGVIQALKADRAAIAAGATKPAQIFKACDSSAQCARCVCDMRKMLDEEREAMRFAAE